MNKKEWRGSLKRKGIFLAGKIPKVCDSLEKKDRREPKKLE